MPSTKPATKQDKLKSIYKDLFSSPLGATVLRDLMAQGFYFGNSEIVPNSVHDTYINLGQRNLVRYILTMIGQAEMSGRDILDSAQRHAQETIDDPVGRILDQ